MKIAVLGSWRPTAAELGWKLFHQDYFVKACEALGKELAQRGHKLVVAQADEYTADKHVARAFHLTAPQIRRITTGRGNRTPGAAHIAAVKAADGIVIMGGAHGSYGAGWAALLTRKKLVPVGCFGGAAKELLSDLAGPIEGPLNALNEIAPDCESGWLKDLTDNVFELLEKYPRILIIHGRSHDRQDVKKILKNAQAEFPELPEPVILQENTLDAKTIPEMFEAMAAQVDAAIAVVTPDDIGATAVNEQGNPVFARDIRTLELRARENVWVEVGWFWGRLGRDKLIILLKGDQVNVPSDLGSVIRHAYDKSPVERKSEILDFVRNIRAGHDTNRGRK